MHGKPAGEKVEALKKDAAIAEAGKLLANTGWLPKPLRGDNYSLTKPGTQSRRAANAKHAAKQTAPAVKAKSAPAKKAAKARPVAKTAIPKKAAKAPAAKRAKAVKP